MKRMSHDQSWQAEPAVLKQRMERLIDPAMAPTLQAQFAERCRRSPDQLAYHSFDDESERWQRITWAQTREQVCRWQQALQAMTMPIGTHVGLRLPTSHDWVVFDQAALGLGFITVPLYMDDSGGNCAYVAEHAELEFLLLANYEQWAEMLASGTTLPRLRSIVILDGDLPKDHDDRVIAASEFLPEQTDIDLQTQAADPHGLATLMYTSGTTGRPKGVMLSHNNLISNACGVLKLATFTKDDCLLSFLPYSHTLGRTVDYYLSVMGGCQIAFNRSIPELADDLMEIKPTYIISVPRVFERVRNKINEKLTGKALARNLFDLAVNVGWHRFQREQGRAGWHPKLLLWPLLDKLVAGKIRQRFGGRLQGAVSGGAPLSYDVAKTFISLGIRILQGYGLTESSPVITANIFEDNNPPSIGKPIEDVEIKLGDNDELLARGPNIMQGYWQNPEATADALDEDGWLHTGDTARIDDDGYVFITGRIKDIIVLANGEKLPPADMEVAIASDTLFDQCLIVGEGKSFLSSMLVLNQRNWESYAKHKGFDASDINSEQAHDAFKQRVAKRISHFPGYAKIYAVHATLEPWTVESGLMTPTMKIKRKELKEHFTKQISTIYEKH